MLTAAGRTVGWTAVRSNHRGFTLIELVVAISLLGVLVALGLPSLVAWIRNSQIRSVTEALQNGMRTAQAEAVRRNRSVVLSFTNATPAANATAVANGKNWSIQTVAQLGDAGTSYVTGGALAEAGSAVSIAGVTSAGDAITAICFNSNGRLVTNAAPGPSGASCSPLVSTFTISQANADRPLKIILQVGGQLRVCDPNRPTFSAAAPDGCPLP